jgi:hypothetical protein
VNERDEGAMQQQHLCECFIDVAGEKLNVVWKGAPDLVPWPEIRVLLEVHGEQSVYDIKPVALGPRESPLREKDRLVQKYGRDEVEKVYAGKSFNMEFFVPGWPIDPAAARERSSKQERPKRTQIHQPEDRV